MIENFFGFPDGVGGAELARLAGPQAERFGAELMVLRRRAGSSADDEQFRFTSERGYAVTADVVLAAPGMVWRRLDAPGVEELLGRGVYYGAGRSEAASCGNDDVVVIGAGNSAGQAAMSLAGAGARVKLVVRGDDLRKSMSAYLVDRIEANDSIEVLLRTQVTAVHGGDRPLEAVTTTTADGTTDRLPARALFICIGGSRARAGRPRAASGPTPRASCLPAPTCSRTASAPPTGRSTATRWCSRRACRACSRRATSGTGPPSASAARWGRARWRSRSRTGGSRSWPASCCRSQRPCS